MLKKVLLIVGVVGLVAVVFASRSWWLPSESSVATSTPLQNTPPVEAEAAVPLSGRGSLSEIQNIGTPLECKIWMTAEGGREAMEGTTFVSGSDIRGDYVTTLDGKEVVSSMIITSDRLYSWSVIDGETYGVEKALTKTSETSPAAKSLDAREPVPVDAEVRYDCVAWRGVDRSVFAPPSNVLFRDLELIMENGQEYGASFEGEAEEGDMCHLCDRVGTAKEKASCREQLKCSQ